MQTAVVRALAYAGVFSSGLTASELFLRVTTDKTYTKSARLLADALSVLLQRGVVRREGGVYWLASLGEGTGAVIHQRRAAAISKNSEIETVGRFLRTIPFVRMVAVTGSVAAKNVVEQDDIDFMIITSPHTLWIVRPLVWWWAWRRGKRRSWQREEPNSWCFNMWLTTDTLQLPQELHSYYGAYELLQARIIVSRGGAGVEWYRQNRWARALFPTWWRERLKTQKHWPEHTSPTAEQVLRFFEVFLIPLNALMYLLQRWYMRDHITREVVGYQRALFHPRPTASRIYARWEWMVRILTPPKKRVLATGVFDLLHQEHRAFLAAAASAGEELWVGVESDVRVRAVKGVGRPIWNQERRRDAVAALDDVEYAFVLPEQFDHPSDHARLLEQVRPAVLAVSSHSPHREEKIARMRDIGGEVRVVYEHHPNVSTSRLITSGQTSLLQSQ